MANTEIDLPFGELVTTEGWDNTVFVYPVDAHTVIFARHKLQPLEDNCKQKFEAKSRAEAGQIVTSLPKDFASFYLWNRKTKLFLVGVGVEDVVMLQSEELKNEFQTMPNLWPYA